MVLVGVVLVLVVGVVLVLSEDLVGGGIYPRGG